MRGAEWQGNACLAWCTAVPPHQAVRHGHHAGSGVTRRSTETQAQARSWSCSWPWQRLDKYCQNKNPALTGICEALHRAPFLRIPFLPALPPPPKSSGGFLQLGSTPCSVLHQHHHVRHDHPPRPRRVSVRQQWAGVPPPPTRNCPECSFHGLPALSPPSWTASIVLAVDFADPSFHVHVRQGAMCELVTPHVSAGGIRTAYVMPNLVPPLTKTEAVLEYKKELHRAQRRVAHDPLPSPRGDARGDPQGLQGGCER
jgi:hypothetical protein